MKKTQKKISRKPRRLRVRSISVAWLRDQGACTMGCREFEELFNGWDKPVLITVPAVRMAYWGVPGLGRLSFLATGFGWLARHTLTERALREYNDLITGHDGGLYPDDAYIQAAGLTLRKGGR